ncbi:hypothetical protein NFI96_033247 [Prochilodus magdalenae]|nr:hypothetical protein NFI96_033247 [Prochilodus magdalenae]
MTVSNTALPNGFCLSTVGGYFMSDSKAVLQGCSDHWTLQDRWAMPLLFQMTVCVDVRVMTPGEWTAFSYTSPRSPYYDLALQGDDSALYAWLLGVRHRFPVQLEVGRWYRLCLRRDAMRDSFSLEVSGNPEPQQRTVIARATPPTGTLLLGCKPRDATPGVTLATMELYLFRVWADVSEHGACEDGTVVSWDSRMWGITRPQAKVQDDALQCGKCSHHGNRPSSMLNPLGHVRVKRNIPRTAPLLSTLALISSIMSQHPQQANTTTTATSPNTNTMSTPTPASSTTSPTADSVHSITGNSQSSSSLSLTTFGSSTAHMFALLCLGLTAASPGGKEASTDNITIHPTTAASTQLNSAYPSPTTLTSTSLTVDQAAFLPTAAFNASSTVSDTTVVQCNLSKLCENTTSYYWMFVNVEVAGSNKSVQDVRAWFSDLFRPACDLVGVMQNSSAMYSNNIPDGAINGTALCQNNTTSKLQDISVDCEDKNDFNKTNCVVVLQLSQPTDTCSIRQLIQDKSRNSSLRAELLGEVERVGRNLCMDGNTLPPGDGLVYCNSSLSASKVCETEKPVNVTCSPAVKKSFSTSGPNNAQTQPCDNNKENLCTCSRFCGESGLFVMFPVTTRVCTYNAVVMVQALACTLIILLLYSCSVALQLSQPLDLCLISEALAALFQSSPFITYDGTLTRLALCGLPSDSASNLLNANFTWVSADISAKQICTLNQISLTSELTCTTDTVNNTRSSPDSTSEEPLSTTQSSSITSEAWTSLNATEGTSKETTTTNTTAIMAAITDRPQPTVQTTSTTTATTTTTTTPTTTTTTTPTTTTTATATTTASPEAEASQLLNQTLNQDMSTINASQLQELVNGVENLLSQPNISPELGQKVLSVIDRLLNSPSDTVATSSNRLIRAVDTLGLKLTIRDKTETLTMESLALMVTAINGNNFMGTSFSITDPLSLQVNRRRRRSASSQLGSITLPASLTEGLSPEEKEQASRIQFTFFTKSTLFKNKTDDAVLNSNILGTSVANLSIKGLKENVVFTLKNKVPTTGNMSCVFWDFDKNGGSGGWNDVGCALLNTSTENETVCSCSHLTSFAVLMDVSRGVVTDRVQATILTFITYIGCGISAIFLSITLLSYLAFEKIRRDIPSKILINLCFALLLLNMVFLLDSWLALYTNAVGLCISTAFFLHYFLLASFTWMGLEALHLYLAIVKVFNNCMSRYILKFALAGWGIPLLVVIIVISVDKNNYGLIQYAKYTDGTTDDFCWLRNNTAFYVAVVAYFCVIFVFNVIMFVVVMVQLRRIKRQNPHNNQYRSGLQDLRSIAGLTILLGLTWGFAFFAWGVVSMAFTYLFTIFNSLQGFFIFVFHCAIKETVRRQWRTYLCCGKFRLPENSDWSRTATQNNTKKTSLATVNSGSQTQSASRSSSLSTNSIPHSNTFNSSMEDSVSTSVEDSSGDVVLNEINSQHRPLHRTD